MIKKVYKWNTRIGTLVIEVKRLNGMNKQPLGIYVHIPFCERKCAYCDFLSGPQTNAVKKEYIEALLKEMEGFQINKDKYQVVSIFFGGGTPSSIEAMDIKRILETLYRKFHIQQGSHSTIEITIEANPGTVDEQKLRVYKEAGINRISMGLQSTNDEELKRLGRIHTYQEFLENYQLAKKVGFTNINVDLMSALPEQTQDSYITTLKRVVELEPTHISAYSLIIEEGTPFYELYGEGKEGERLLPSEEEDREFYVATKTVLAEHGYHRYEISNYAKEGYECLHNSLYWTGVSYVGFGLGASSYFEGCRYHNVEDTSNYINALKTGKSVTCNVQELSESEQMEEMMFLGLRMIKGVSQELFYQRFGKQMSDVYGEVIERFKMEGLLCEKGGYLCLTDEGIDVSNYVMSEFLLS